jgi:hypothetical protein
MKINPEVINVIKSSQVQDNTLRLPEGKMERKLYEQVSKLLKEMGGKWSSAKKIFVFQEDVAETLADIIAIGEYTPDRKTFQYFPTPLPLAEQMVSRADIQPGESCLEPSAGQGNIARFMPSPHCIELNPKNREVLKEAGFNVVAEDFMKFSPDRLYDVIVMNPPFSEGRAEAHVRHAAGLLNEDGVIVAILPSSLRGKEVVKGMNHEWTEVFQGEFDDTGVSVAIVKITKK